MIKSELKPISNSTVLEPSSDQPLYPPRPMKISACGSSGVNPSLRRSRSHVHPRNFRVLSTAPVTLVSAALLTGYQHGDADKSGANGCNNPRPPSCLLLMWIHIEYQMDKGGVDAKRHGLQSLSGRCDWGPWGRCLSGARPPHLTKSCPFKMSISSCSALLFWRICVSRMIHSRKTL
jgi:hypothetical protein